MGRLKIALIVLLGFWVSRVRGAPGLADERTDTFSGPPPPPPPPGPLPTRLVAMA